MSPKSKVQSPRSKVFSVPPDRFTSTLCKVWKWPTLSLPTLSLFTLSQSRLLPRAAVIGGKRQSGEETKWRRDKVKRQSGRDKVRNARTPRTTHHAPRLWTLDI